MAIGNDLRRRVTRRETEAEAVDEILSGMQATLRDHSERFDRLDTRLDRMGSRYDGTEATLVEVLCRLPEAS